MLYSEYEPMCVILGKMAAVLCDIVKRLCYTWRRGVDDVTVDMACIHEEVSGAMAFVSSCI